MVSKSEINEMLEKGGVVSRVIVELQGSPKEHISKTLGLVENNISEKFTVIEKAVSDVEELEDHENIFSAFIEFEIAFETLDSFTNFCFDYTPSSVEILEPTEFSFDSNKMTDYLNDIVTKLHNTGNAVKQLSAHNQILQQSIIGVIQNTIRISLIQKNLTGDELSKVTGVSEKELEPILNKLVEDKKILFENNKYSIKK